MTDHPHCWRIDRIFLAGRTEYRYRCRDCGKVHTAIEARRLGDGGPIETGDLTCQGVPMPRGK